MHTSGTALWKCVYVCACLLAAIYCKFVRLNFNTRGNVEHCGASMSKRCTTVLTYVAACLASPKL